MVSEGKNNYKLLVRSPKQSSFFWHIIQPTDETPPTTVVDIRK